MKIVRGATALALLIGVPVVYSKVRDAMPEHEDYETAVAGIPATDKNGNPPKSMGLEGENYRTAVSGIPPKEAKHKKVPKKEAPVAETQIKKTKKIKRPKKQEIIATKVGDTFTIELPASPTLGRTWKIHKKLPAKVEQEGESEFVKGKKGSKYEGTIVYTFKATQPGKATITMKKIYPKGMKKPLKLKAYTIEIAE